MLVLTLLGLIHVAYSNDIGSYVYGVKPLPDFDEVDPIVETEGQYETISPMELKRLSRKVDGILKHHIHGFSSNSDDAKGLNTGVSKIQNERNVLNAELDEVNNKVSQELVLQNLKKVRATLSTRNPFFGSKDYFRERNLFRSLTSLVDTPYTRSNWDPNFLRTVIE